jgi:putative membrane protein
MVADHTKSAKALKDAIGGAGQDFSMPANLDTEHQAQIDVLQSLQGAAFDREYISQQMAAHSKALALLKAYGGEGDDAELRQFAQSTIPVVQKHHDWLQSNASDAATAQTPAP